ncbi:MAG: hypothetical protein GY906_39010 [bacterium]|nr:hypothetical protein [bacterium]
MNELERQLRQVGLGPEHLYAMQMQQYMPTLADQQRQAAAMRGQQSIGQLDYGAQANQLTGLGSQGSETILLGAPTPLANIGALAAGHFRSPPQPRPGLTRRTLRLTWHALKWPFVKLVQLYRRYRAVTEGACRMKNLPDWK